MFEYGDLVLPMPAKFRRSIKTNLADISGFRKQSVKKSQFIVAFVGQLGMQPKPRPYPSAVCQPMRTFPSTPKVLS